MDRFRLYDTWFAPLAQLSPDDCQSRIRNLTLLIVGLYRALSVHLSAIVCPAYGRRAVPHVGFA